MTTKIRLATESDIAAAATILPSQIDAAVSTAVATAVPDVVATQVPPVVAAAVAAAPTVAAAAAAAVSTAIAALDVLVGGNIVGDGAIAFTIVGADGRRSWVEIDNAGAPTPHAIDMLNVAIGPAVAAAATSAATAAAAASGTVVLANPEATGYLFSLEDSTGRMAMGVRVDGTVDIFKPGVGGVADGTITVSKLAPEVSSRLRPVRTRDVICWGDSMTASGYGTTVASVTGLLVRNGGVGGEASPCISARQGGNPFLALPVGLSIPTSGPVNLTSFVPNGPPGGNNYPLLHGTGGASPFSGSINGVPGVINLVKPSGGSSHNSDDYYTFTRTAPGSVVPVTRPAPFYTDFAMSRRGDIAILWMGRNDVGSTTPLRALDEIPADILFLTTDRYLVMEVAPSSADDAGMLANIALVNATLQARYGRRLVQQVKYLIAYGLADAGITPTSQDTIDIAGGFIPTSLHNPGDTVHLNPAGCAVIGTIVGQRIQEMGW